MNCLCAGPSESIEIRYCRAVDVETASRTELIAIIGQLEAQLAGAMTLTTRLVSSLVAAIVSRLYGCAMPRNGSGINCMTKSYALAGGGQPSPMRILAHSRRKLSRFIIVLTGLIVTTKQLQDCAPIADEVGVGGVSSK